MADTMKALALTDFDEQPAVIDVPIPGPGPGEVQVRVKAASVNAYDTFVAMGAAKTYMSYAFPVVLGGDVAGTVEAVGEGVDVFSPGDRVFGMMGMKGAIHDGSFGELATPQAAALARTPETVADEQAGSLGVAGTTAMSAVNAVELTEGSSVLIVGATGGVGTIAIQLAAARGAHVIASVRPGDEDVVHGLGAADTVDYTGDLAKVVRERYPDGVDALLDLVNRAPETFATLVGLVSKGGRATSVVGAAGEASEIDAVDVSNTSGDPAHLDALGALVAAGTVRIHVQRTYPLVEAAKALADFTNEHTVGKRIIVSS
jgi:NADPH:quinone reductase-like Zn-dependent oxidoreductase